MSLFEFIASIAGSAGDDLLNFFEQAAKYDDLREAAVRWKKFGSTSLNPVNLAVQISKVPGQFGEIVHGKLKPNDQPHNLI